MNQEDPSKHAAPVSAGLKQAVVAHYERRLRRYGATAKGMDWKDEASQQLRFRVLCQVCELEGLEVHEVGAGTGHLCDFLAAHGIHAVYSGSDLSAAMVEAAQRLHPRVSFEQCDILVSEPGRRYDVVLSSGVFQVRLDRSDDEWWRYMQAMLTRMYSMAEVAIAFNFMSDQVDYRSKRLYYPSVSQVLDFCRCHLSRFVVLRHDYPLHESTVYVYRHSALAEAKGGTSA